jgi:hypothetical protein
VPLPCSCSCSSVSLPLAGGAPPACTPAVSSFLAASSKPHVVVDFQDLAPSTAPPASIEARTRALYGALATRGLRAVVVGHGLVDPAVLPPPDTVLVLGEAQGTDLQALLHSPRVVRVLLGTFALCWGN